MRLNQALMLGGAVLGVAAAFACTNPNDLRARAASDLNCPEAIQLVPVSDVLVRAKGCNDEATYEKTKDGKWRWKNDPTPKDDWRGPAGRG